MPRRSPCCKARVRERLADDFTTPPTDIMGGRIRDRRADRYAPLAKTLGQGSVFRGVGRVRQRKRMATCARCGSTLAQR
jgi:hypothetical protein